MQQTMPLQDAGLQSVSLRNSQDARGRSESLGRSRGEREKEPRFQSPSRDFASIGGRRSLVRILRAAFAAEILASVATREKSEGAREGERERRSSRSFRESQTQSRSSSSAFTRRANTHNTQSQSVGRPNVPTPAPNADCCSLPPLL